MAEEFPNEAFSHPVVKIEPADEWPGHDDFFDVTKGEPDNNLHPEESESEICKTSSMDPTTFSTFVKQEIKDEPRDEQETCETKAGTSTDVAVKQEETTELDAKNSDQTQIDIKPDCDSSTVGGSVCNERSESVSESSDSVSLPDGLIIQKLKRDSSGRAKEGVWTTKLFPKGTVFGPYATTPSSSKTSAADLTWITLVRESSVKTWCNTEAFSTSAGRTLATIVDIKPEVELVRQIDLEKLRKIKAMQGTFPYTCPDCEESFSQFRQLTSHLFTHKDPKPYRCLECDACFSKPSHLDSHMNTHTGERPYVCEECGKSFSTPGNLKSHYIVHSRERPHICEECGKSFSTPGTLRNHYIVHSDETPFKCQYCERAFKYPRSLDRHKCTPK